MMEKTKVKVKILGLSCAVRRGRNTAWLVVYALKAAEKLGRRISELADVETEFIDLAHKDIRPCTCGMMKFCLPNKGLPWKGDEIKQDFGCTIQNDYISQLMPKFAAADGFILGAPVHQHSYNGRFRMLIERLGDGVCKGYFTNKPVGLVTTAYLGPPFGGYDQALRDMSNMALALETMVVGTGSAVSGPPYGAQIADDDARDIGVKKDELGKRSVAIAGRAVAEFAVMLKLARQKIGPLYDREFMHHLHPPHGEHSWAWTRLDKEDESYMRSLP